MHIFLMEFRFSRSAERMGSNIPSGNPPGGFGFAESMYMNKGILDFFTLFL